MPGARPGPVHRVTAVCTCAGPHACLGPQCSRSCGGGFSVRDVQCVDTRDLRPLRPFHCQPGPAPPPARQPCGAQPCLSWYTSSWREVRPGVGWGSAQPCPAVALPCRDPCPSCPQCSEACGGGEQKRLVTCPQPGLCEEVLRPNATRPCNTHPCTKWVVGPWSQVRVCRGRPSGHCRCSGGQTRSWVLERWLPGRRG